MNFTLKELETIKDALQVALDHEDELDEGALPVIEILDRIDNESGLD